MREVANFMRFYPAYKLRDVLNEYAVTFFALLNEGYRLQYGDYQILSQISDLPNMKNEDRKQFYQNLKWASTHPSDILKSSDTSSSPADIKRILSGK